MQVTSHNDITSTLNKTPIFATLLHCAILYIMDRMNRQTKCWPSDGRLAAGSPPATRPLEAAAVRRVLSCRANTRLRSRSRVSPGTSSVACVCLHSAHRIASWQQLPSDQIKHSLFHFPSRRRTNIREKSSESAKTESYHFISPFILKREATKSRTGTPKLTSPESEPKRREHRSVLRSFMRCQRCSRRSR